MAADTPSSDTIFCAAIEMASASERAAYIVQACGEDKELRARVQKLVDAHFRAGNFLESPADVGATVDSQPPAAEEDIAGQWHAEAPRSRPVAERPGAVIGPYKLVQEIGEGGMGTVFLAQQTEPVKRLVALKVIKPGMDSRQVIARFEAERQALALMDHPNIAKVLDAGATDSGRPYFVMELVKGVPITRYCDEHHLTPRQRLELMVPICQAVQHAHQKGIIHRDLKPSNVLVASYDGKPVPKVIDFGLAKAAGQQLAEHTLVTGFGAVVGTLEYMSPEQAEFNQLDIDTRSDVYSLGVLLYELLTGTTPLEKKRLKEAAMMEVLRLIREEEPPRPSTRLSTVEGLPSIAANRGLEPKRLSGMVRGELDWIVMKALEKDRIRRYETANGLALDLQRYLADEAVQACPPSAGYRFRKFARRNKRLLLTASVVGVAAMVGIGSLIGAVRVLAGSNAQIKGEQKQTKEALEREIQAKKQLERALYFQRIASAERELATHNAARAEELLDECPLSLRGWEWHYLKRLRYQPPLVFRGHGDWVMGAAFSPDGRRVASSSGVFFNTLGEIKVWDRTTGEVLHTLLGHFGPATGVAFSPDGRRLASAGWDKTVMVWDVDRGRPLRTLEGHREYVSCVAFSSDGKLLVSGSGDRTVKVWDAATYQELRTLHGHTKGLHGVAFGPDGKTLASASADGTVRLWDAVAGEELHVLRGHAGPVLNLAFSRDGRSIASAGGDGTVRLWAADTGTYVRTLHDSSALVVGVAFSPDGTRLAAGGWEKVVKVWDLESEQEALTLRGHEDMVMAVAFSPDGLQIASAGLDRTVRVWDAAPPAGLAGRELRTLRGHTAGVTGVAWRPPDGKVLASAGFDATVKLWDADSGQELRTLPHAGPAADVSFSRDGKVLASADIAGVVKVWDVASGREVRTFRGFSVRVALSPDGRRLASAAEGAKVHVWEVGTGKEVVGPFLAHDAPVMCVAFSPDGRHLVTGSWDKTAKVWDAATGRKQLTLRGHQHLVYGVAFSPDGKRLATASWDGTAKVWDAATGKQLLSLDSHKDQVFSVAFSPDGRLLATTSWGGAVKVWGTATGEEITTLRGHSAAVMGVAFSPDGRRLATSGGYRSKGEVTIWDATGWQEKPKAP